MFFVFLLTTAACGKVLLWIGVISERQIQGHGILHKNHISQFYGLFPTHPTPTGTHPSSLKSDCLLFAVRKFYNKLNCDQRPPHQLPQIHNPWLAKTQRHPINHEYISFLDWRYINLYYAAHNDHAFEDHSYFPGQIFSFWILVLFLKFIKRSGLEN